VTRAQSPNPSLHPPRERQPWGIGSHGGQATARNFDGVRRSLDGSSYTIRFTPRNSGSNWSAVNLKRAQELAETGRMLAAGLKAFQNRNKKKAGYSYEERNAVQLAGEYEQRFRTNVKAWSFFQTRAPSYRRTAVFWVMSKERRDAPAAAGNADSGFGGQEDRGAHEKSRSRQIAGLMHCGVRNAERGPCQFPKFGASRCPVVCGLPTGRGLLLNGLSATLLRFLGTTDRDLTHTTALRYDLCRGWGRRVGKQLSN